MTTQKETVEAANNTKVVAFDIWDGVGEANKSFLVPKPTTWLAKIAADLRAAFSQFSKFGINPASLLSGNVSLRSLLSTAIGLASSAAKASALADAKSKFESSVNDEGLVWDNVTGQAAYSSENGTHIDASTVPNIFATQDGVTFKQATNVLLALKMVKRKVLLKL